MLDRGHAPGQQLELPFAERSGEASVRASGGGTPVGDERLLERVVERRNLLAALARVKRNGGSPGIDGMTVEAWPGYLREHWPEIRAALLAGTYRPPPVKRVEIPKPEGGVRQLGVPTARWDLKEAAGKRPTQGTRTACEAAECGRGSVGVRSPMASGTLRWRCGGDGRKVTRLTRGALATGLRRGRPRGFPTGGQQSAEGEKDRRSEPRPEQVTPARCHHLADRRRRRDAR
jgi:hypothetical protein